MSGTDERLTGTDRVKRGLAEMLRGGVIMDVVDGRLVLGPAVVLVAVLSDVESPGLIC